MDSQPGDTDNQSGESSPNKNPIPIKRKPPFYDFIYLVSVCVSISGFTWLFRSGALQLWDRHPRAGENYDYGWGIALLFAIPSGVILGSLVMFQFLMWYQRRSEKRGENDSSGYVE